MALEQKMANWGIHVQSVEIRDVIIPAALEDAMSRQAQAERERQARIILGTAETEIAHKFVEAADAYRDHPAAMNLRAMNMLYESIVKRGSLMVVPSGLADSLNVPVADGHDGRRRTRAARWRGPRIADGRRRSSRTGEGDGARRGQGRAEGPVTRKRSARPGPREHLLLCAGSRANQEPWPMSTDRTPEMPESADDGTVLQKRVDRREALGLLRRRPGRRRGRGGRVYAAQRGDARGARAQDFSNGSSSPRSIIAA